MIASMGSDVKPLALSPSPPHVKLEGDVKEPTHLSTREGNVARGAAACPKLIAGPLLSSVVDKVLCAVTQF